MLLGKAEEAGVSGTRESLGRSARERECSVPDRHAEDLASHPNSYHRTV